MIDNRIRREQAWNHRRGDRVQRSMAGSLPKASTGPERDGNRNTIQCPNFPGGRILAQLRARRERKARTSGMPAMPGTEGCVTEFDTSLAARAVSSLDFGFESWRPARDPKSR